MMIKIDDANPEFWAMIKEGEHFACLRIKMKEGDTISFTNTFFKKFGNSVLEKHDTYRIRILERYTDYCSVGFYKEYSKNIPLFEPDDCGFFLSFGPKLTEKFSLIFISASAYKHQFGINYKALLYHPKFGLICNLKDKSLK